MLRVIKHMSIIQAITLGIIQGLTEFLPVSSSGHLIFIPVLFGWQDQGIAFDVVVHLGSLLAVVVYFRKKLGQLIRAFFSRNTAYASDRRLAWFVGLSIIPAGAVGYFLETNSRSALVVGISFIVWGIMLGIADWYQKQRVKTGKKETDVNHLSKKQVLLIAVAQAIALIPGTSRSGITMTAGLGSGLSKKAAAEFSFLMSVPIIFLAGMMKVLEFVEQGSAGVSAGALSAGFIAAGLSGFLAITGLMKLIQSRGFLPFVVYRVIIGALILIFLV